MLYIYIIYLMNFIQNILYPNNFLDFSTFLFYNKFMLFSQFFYLPILKSNRHIDNVFLKYL